MFYYDRLGLASYDPNAFVGRNDAYTNDTYRKRESFRMAYRWDVTNIPDWAVIDTVRLELDW